jgi:hypothetical protein
MEWVVLVVLLAAAGVGGYFLVKHVNSPEARRQRIVEDRRRQQKIVMDLTLQLAHAEEELERLKKLEASLP